MPRTHPLPSLTILAMALLATTALADWQGETATVDGTTTVRNPEAPAQGETVQVMRELWRRGGEDDEILFGTIAEFLHDDDGNIYLLDGQLSEIQVFDRGGEWLRTVGRQGEGPGEFQNGADMFWGPGGQIGVVQAWPGKVVMITPEGDPGRTFALPYRDGGGWQSVTRGAGQGEEDGSSRCSRRARSRHRSWSRPSSRCCRGTSSFIFRVKSRPMK